MSATSPFLLPSACEETTAPRSMLIRAWVPVLMFACIFAIESNAQFGADHTSAPLHSFFYGLLGPVVDLDWSAMHHDIRKTGHFFGYGIFSLICFRGFWLSIGQGVSFLKRRLLCNGMAVLATALVASADEFHQSFLANRTGTPADVMLDTTGALVLQMALFLVLWCVDWQAARALGKPDEEPFQLLKLAA